MPLGDLRLQATFWPGGRVPADGHLALWGGDDPARAAAAFGMPAGEAAVLPAVAPANPRARRKVVVADVPARVVSVGSAVRALAAIAPGRLAELAASRRIRWWHGASPPSWLSSMSRQGMSCPRCGTQDLTGRSRTGGSRRATTAGSRCSPRRCRRPPMRCAATRTRTPFGRRKGCWLRLPTRSPTRAPVPGGRRPPRAPRRSRALPFEQCWTAALTGADPVVELPTKELVDELCRWSAPVARREWARGRAAVRPVAHPELRGCGRAVGRWCTTYRRRTTRA